MRDDFRRGFTALTGFTPLSWQERLYREHLVRGELPAAVDVPTGLGKTAVMALWLIARAHRAALPRRLVYVVDRRAVVDQATEFAVELRARLEAPAAIELKNQLGIRDRALPISTLRGQHADNRQWLEDPAAVAIVVGTVDMIGSRLLFEGYGVSRKMRPYHAGLLGADSLVVLDEAHLVPPFEQLLETIERAEDQFGPRHWPAEAVVPPFRLLSLSATGRKRQGVVFRLSDSDLSDETVAKRLTAAKVLSIHDLDGGDVAQELAKHAWRLAGEGSVPVRCLIFCDRRAVAEETHAALRLLLCRHSGGDTAPALSGCELFVGARRVFERQQAATRLEALGFLAGTAMTHLAPAFVVATSAAEVGVDLDSDHIVCDLVAWERMVQRLGRVNRRGERDASRPARVVVLDLGPLPSRDAPTEVEIKQHAARRAVLEALPLLAGTGRDASPAALRDLYRRANDDASLGDLVAKATTTPPLRPELTRALIDAWSMTALEEHSGRPEVQPWLRGWVDDPPQTAVLWRRYLPVRSDGRALPATEVNAFFEAAPPHVSELLETETWRVVEWLAERAARVPRSARAVGNEDESPAPAAGMDEDVGGEGDEPAEAPAEVRVDPPPLDVVAFVLSSRGDVLEALRLEMIAGLQGKAGRRDRDRLHSTLAGAALVVDARLGGLTEGLLNPDADATVHAADDEKPWLDPVENAPVVRFRVRRLPAGFLESPSSEWRERLRAGIADTAEGEVSAWLVVEKWRADAATEDDRSVGPPQILDEHEGWAEGRARVLASRLGLQGDDAEMLALAARLHDEGKRADRWQRAFNAPRDGEIYAKTLGPMNWRLLDGYRHEFGSVPYAQGHPELRALPRWRQDLVLHLIAAHHGRARPLISPSGCEDAPPSALRERACQIALRFTRLQRQWGPWGLAWWEALVRAADQQASRDNDRRNAQGVEE